MVSIWSITAEMAPYLLLGFLAAGLLSVVMPPSFIEKHLGRKPYRAIFKAALLGVPMPLCSCSVIPVAASLRKHGAGKGATVSFLSSTPQTGVDSLMATLALLGPFFTIVRVVIAFFSGFISGAVVHFFDTNSQPVEQNEKESCCHCDDRTGRDWLGGLHYGFIKLPGDIGKALTVGLILSGVVSIFLNGNMEAVQGEHYLLSMLAVLAFAIPLYVCSTGSIPIAMALIQAGISPGTALVFLIAGPATNTVTVTTLWKTLGRRSTVLYLLTIVFVSLSAGMLLDLLPFSYTVINHVHQHEQATTLFQHLAGAVLFVLLLFSRFKK